ncbi:MAG: MotA/TolQ/ExbB proton channel family protein [Pseudomonadota bacterium]
MGQIIGFLLMLALITGGVISTGATPVLAALPFELGLIGGTALAALLIGNAPSIAGDALRGLGLAVTGSRWKRADFTALLGALHGTLTLVRRGGAPAIDAVFEAPEGSEMLRRATRLLEDRDAMNLLEESARHLAAGSLDRPMQAHQLADQMQRTVAAAHHRRMQAVGALQSMADALPALGIVAAVLGIIKTMTAIDESEAVIGAMIATALLGTFLGVFLAYGLVGPLANRFAQVVDEELLALDVIEAVISAAAGGSAPRLAIEAGRNALPLALRPDDAAIDAALSAVGGPLRVVHRGAA